MSENVFSSVSTHGGVPTLFINGKPEPGMAYITYYTHKNDYEGFAGVGVRLYSVPVFFATRTINAVTGIPPFGEGVFEKDRSGDFSAFDRDIQRILSACPGAYVFPRVNLSVPRWFDDEHPEALCDTGFLNEKRTCFSSDVWVAETKRMLRLFLQHIQQAPYREHIIGYQLAGGNTEEWFSFDQKGSIGEASREKFSRDDRFAKTEEGYYRFLSQIVADRILEFAGLVKELTANQLIVGAFYGYTLECVDRVSCHHALKTILDSSLIDFICSPISYNKMRAVGRDHANMLPVDSLKLHGKLYFAENDTRTELTGPPNDLPYYNNGLWKGPEHSITENIIKMHFARTLCHGHACWWFDMWGGWYRDERYRELFASVKKITDASLQKPMQSRSQVAVFVDEEAYCRLQPGQDDAKLVCYEFRETLGKASTPYDIYLIDDFHTVIDRYKAAVFLVPYETEKVSRAVEEIKIPYLRITKENASMPTDTLRAFYKQSGVKVYFDFDAVVYENESFFFLHTCVDETYTLPACYTNAFTGEKGFSGFLKKGESLLFLQ